MRATILLQWWQRRLDCKDACALTPAADCNEGKDTSLTTAKTPAHWWRQQPHCYKGNNTSSITLLAQLQQRCHQWGQQLQLQRWQRRLRVNGNIAITMRATAPLQWRHGCLHINNDNNAIATRAPTPASGWQQCHHNKGNKAVVDQGQWCHCYEGNNAIYTMARMLVHQQRQWRHCHEDVNRNCNNRKNLYIDGNNAITRRVTMPAWQQALRAMMLAQQR